MSLIHIAKKAEEICKKLESEGFNGVRFCNVYVENQTAIEDWISDGYSKEYAEAFVENYAIFVAQHDIHYLDNFAGCSEYHESYFDEDKFIQDLKAYMQEQFGDDAEISYRPGCYEFEVSRKDKDERLLKLQEASSQG